MRNIAFYTNLIDECKSLIELNKILDLAEMDEQINYIDFISILDYFDEIVSEKF